MMSRAWATKHKVELAAGLQRQAGDPSRSRNANGTGPYMLERYEPDNRTVLKTNPRWWGWSDKRSATSTR